MNLKKIIFTLLIVSSSLFTSKAFSEYVYESIVDYVGYFSSQSSAITACRAKFPSSVCAKEWGTQDPCRIVRAGVSQFPANDGFILYGCDTVLSHNNATNFTVRARDTSWYVVYQNRCSAGTKLNELTGACDSSNKYTIKLSTVTAQPYGNYLTALEPDGIYRKPGGKEVPEKLINKVNLVAEVKDQDGNRVNAAIKLKVTAVEDTGGHVQVHHTDRNPSQAGTLKIGTLQNHTIDIPKSSMIDGIVEFEFEASLIAGDHKIEASCTDITCEQIGKDSVWVGIQDLKTLPASSDYIFIGESCHHPENHYATDRVIQKVQGIAHAYRDWFPTDPVLYINDISLERGGLFDAKSNTVPKDEFNSTLNNKNPPFISCDATYPVKAKWTPAHVLHRTGEDVDVRANNLPTAIPKANYADFKFFAQANGCVAGIHKLGTTSQHFHLYCTQKQGK